ARGGDVPTGEATHPRAQIEVIQNRVGRLERGCRDEVDYRLPDRCLGIGQVGSKSWPDDPAIPQHLPEQRVDVDSADVIVLMSMRDRPSVELSSQLAVAAGDRCTTHFSETP